jgi:hypothetical protein
MRMTLLAVALALGCADEPDVVRMAGNWDGDGQWTNGFGQFACVVQVHLAPFEGGLVGTIRATGPDLEGVANVEVDSVDEDGDVEREYDECKQSGANAADFTCPFAGVAATEDTWTWDGADEIVIEAGDLELDGANHVTVVLDREEQ